MPHTVVQFLLVDNMGNRKSVVGHDATSSNGLKSSFMVEVTPFIPVTINASDGL